VGLWDTENKKCKETGDFVPFLKFRTKWLIGAVLVVLPAFQKLLGQKPVNVAKIGLILGLVATVVEFGLFILAWIFSCL
jgi:hypothetical protein